MSIRSAPSARSPLCALIAGLAGCGIEPPRRRGGDARAAHPPRPRLRRPARRDRGEHARRESPSASTTRASQANVPASALDFITRSIPLREARSNATIRGRRERPREALIADRAPDQPARDRAAAKCWPRSALQMRWRRCPGRITGAPAPRSGASSRACGPTTASSIGDRRHRRGRRSRCAQGGHSIAGSFAFPRGELPAAGRRHRERRRLPLHLVPGRGLPDRAPLRVYVFKLDLLDRAALCGADAQRTPSSTRCGRVAHLIYSGRGRQARAARRSDRVQRDQALLRAVAAAIPAATRRAIDSLLNQHIVRLRVSAGGRLLSDVGGPFVLAPVSAPLHLGGRAIGSFVLSIQDDEGYKRLTGRLVGLERAHVHGLAAGEEQPRPEARNGSRERHLPLSRARLPRVHAARPGPSRRARCRSSVLIPIPYS